MTTATDFDAALRATTAPNGLPSFTDQLVLVVGVGRSGTTALKHSLGSHPQLLDTFQEAPLQRAIASSYGRHLVADEDFRQFVRRATVASWDNIDVSFKRLILEASLGDDAGLERLREEFLAGTDLTNLHGWIAKIGGLGKAAAAGFAALFDDFKPVYIQRNGIDTVLSRTRFGAFAAEPFTAHCEKWALSLRFLRVLRRESDVVVVRHEDLVHRPVELFDRVLAEIGLDPDPGPANYAVETAAHPTQTFDDGQSIAQHFENRPDAHSSWNDEQKRIFIKVCGKAMSELGYDIPFA